METNPGGAKENNIPVWKNWLALLFVWPLAWLVFLFFSKIAGMYAGLLLNESGEAIPVENIAWLQMLVSGFSMGIATLLIHFVLLQKSWSQTGLDTKDFSKNAAAGVLTALFILAQFSWLLSITGILSFAGIESDIQLFFKYFIAMAFVAIGEELLFRSLVISNLPGHWPKLVCLSISALIFAIAHAQNPSQHPLAMAGVFVGGLLLGVNYLFTRNLWFGIALHFCWNFFLGPVLGFAVSGHSMQTLLQQNELNGPAWLTGGAFGPEASLVVILLNLATAFFLFRQWKRNAESRQVASFS